VAFFRFSSERAKPEKSHETVLVAFFRFSSERAEEVRVGQGMDRVKCG